MAYAKNTPWVDGTAGGTPITAALCFRSAFWRSIHGPIVASVQYGVRPMTPVGSGICLRDR